MTSEEALNHKRFRFLSQADFRVLEIPSISVHLDAPSVIPPSFP